ncbi:phage holin family protein [Nocardioides cavernaquae]|uniref:Phage holin family protein n=1 Tax=Nocardioides cavernaquae TaxID=2321396 RepID=A0A3A5H603_9ACTN|nr:phage holin family protein [Nocardioides cavernaquae]RJS45972.1 phage holin family protein [Nocardioides cavernaquae]
MKLLLWILTTMAGLAVAAWLLDGIHLDGATWQDKLLPLAGAAVILGLVSISVKPVVKLLSLPFIIVTIGLFLLVINALMLMLTSWIAGKADVGFTVDGFWAALVGSVIVTLVTGFIDMVAIEDD